MSENATNKLDYVRLMTGESVIADVAHTADGKIQLYRPIQVIIERTRQGSELVLFPFIPVSSTEAEHIQIDPRHVLYVVPVIEAVSKYLTNYAEKIYNPVKGEATPEVAENKPVSSTQDVLELMQKLTGSPKDPKKPN